MYGIKHLVISLSALCSLIPVLASSAALGGCYCTASDNCWPTSKEWDAFNSTIGGRLVSPKPTGYYCHEPHYDATKCQTAQNNFSNPFFRASNAGSTQNVNWEEDGTQRCAIEAPNNAPCSQGRVSVFGVQVEQLDDVQKAVKFAARKNLRLAVKSTGHDYNGRSSAPGSFLIWLHKLKKISINYEFTPAGSSCMHSQPAITISGGVGFGEVYDALKGTGYIILGGLGLTVCSSGGWVQGGGHGPLGPLFGLGVDNVLQVDVVTADGKLRTVNAIREPELFFAIRGGGGGTFGVVTSITYKLHKNPDNLVSTFFLLSPSKGRFWSVETRKAVLTVWSQHTPALDAARWGGYWGFGPTGFNGSLVAPGTLAEINASITPVAEAMSQIANVTVSVSSRDTPTFQDWLYSHYNLYPGSTGSDFTGSRMTLGSRLIPYTALADPSTLADNIVTAMTTSGTNQLLGSMVLGPGVREADPHRLTAVTPAFRNAIWHIVMGTQWSWKATDLDEGAARNRTLTFVKSLQSAYPDSGAYFNEASVDEPQWRKSFWGRRNYAKLMAVKLRVDPFGLFTCPKCVGSELWNRNGSSCKAGQSIAGRLSSLATQ